MAAPVSPPWASGSPYVLHGLLSSAAQRDPGREAVRCAGRAMAYGDLDAAANGLGRALMGAGIRRGDRVGILLPKSVEMVAAVYGVMKAGAAYVPLDPQGPLPRAAAMASDCEVAAVVSAPGTAEALVAEMGAQGHTPRGAVLVGREPGGAGLPCPVIDYEEATSGPDLTDPAVPVIDQDLAYILYTSGSTGAPKGVMLTHRNALTFVEWAARTIGVGPEDRVSNHAPLHFDLSVFDLYLAALGGATVVLVPGDEAYFGSALVELIQRERITVWYSVPSALMVIGRALKAPGLLPSLRAVVFAGEVYPTNHLRELRRLVPGAVLWNLYGPTETNVATYYRVDDIPQDETPIPIGRACENTEVFVRTDDGRLAGVGGEGELYVLGSSVMSGYWNKPDRSAEVLVPSPAPGRPAGVAYRTGDLVRVREDGAYDFLGRRDHQIKSRGYRIELGEIEWALGTHPSVAAGVAVAAPHEEWGSVIVAVVVVRTGAVLSENDVKRHVAARLPRYMVPDRVEVLAELPRTTTGKVDRQLLTQLVTNGTRADR